MKITYDGSDNAIEISDGVRTARFGPWNLLQMADPANIGKAFALVDVRDGVIVCRDLGFRVAPDVQPPPAFQESTQAEVAEVRDLLRRHGAIEEPSPPPAGSPNPPSGGPRDGGELFHGALPLDPEADRRWDELRARRTEEVHPIPPRGEKPVEDRGAGPGEASAVSSDAPTSDCRESIEENRQGGDASNGVPPPKPDTEGSLSAEGEGAASGGNVTRAEEEAAVQSDPASADAAMRPPVVASPTSSAGGPGVPNTGPALCEVPGCEEAGEKDAEIRHAWFCRRFHSTIPRSVREEFHRIRYPEKKRGRARA